MGPSGFEVADLRRIDFLGILSLVANLAKIVGFGEITGIETHDVGSLFSGEDPASEFEIKLGLENRRKLQTLISYKHELVPVLVVHLQKRLIIVFRFPLYLVYDVFE